MAWFSPSEFIIDGKKGGALAGGAAALGGSGGGTGGGGGWSLDRPTAEKLLTTARDQVRATEARLRVVRELTQTQSASEDFVSVGFNKAGVEGWQAGLRSDLAQQKYWQDLATSLEKALGHMTETDEQAGQDVGKPAGQDDSSGGGLI